MKPKSQPKKQSNTLPAKITKDNNINDLIKAHPETIEVLLDYGLHCVGCPASQMDSIENGAQMHGLDDSQITELVNRINEVIKYKE